MHDNVKHLIIPLGLCSLLAAGCEGGEPETDGESTAAFELHQATVMLPGFAEQMTVAYQVKGGLAIFQGDIILGEVDEDGELLPRFRSIIYDYARGSWPGGIVPYAIADDVSSGPILTAIQRWEDRTDIRFVAYDPNEHSNYVEFVRGTDPGACYSEVGMLGGRQTIQTTPSDSCGADELTHEIGHTLGLHHEHVRADRDQAVTINWDNIEAGREMWFCRFSGDPLQGDELEFCPPLNQYYDDFGEYDYDSLMHYTRTAFGRKVNGQTLETITPDDPNALIGEAAVPSAGDVAAIESMYSFAMNRWSPNFCTEDTEVCATGDFDGDGSEDALTFHRGSYGGSSDVWVALSDEEGAFVDAGKWTQSFCGESQEQCMTGDFDGDGRDDVITFHHGAWNGSSQVFVYLSDGSDSFDYTGAPWANNFCVESQEQCMTGDFDGDGRDDILTFHRGAWGGSTTVFVYLSDGSDSFDYTGSPWHSSFCVDGMTCEVGDVDGDGRDDIIAFVQDAYGGVYENQVWVATSTGSGFGTTYLWHDDFCSAGQRCLVGDVDGDGRDDIVAVDHSTIERLGEVEVARSTGAGFGTVEAAGKSRCYYENYICDLADTDPGGHADLVVFTQSTYAYPDGEVWVGTSGLKHVGE